MPPDLALPAGKERSWHAFAAADLLDVVERFAVEWDGLPTPHPRDPKYRLLIGVGQVVALYAIEAQLAPDGAVELVSVDGPSWHVGESGRSALAPLSGQAAAS